MKKIFLLIICLVFFQTTFAQWQKVDLKTFAWFRSVYFVNQNKGWIVGSRGTFYETTDGGTNWKINKKITQDSILDVYFASENHGWILCERDFFGAGNAAPSYIMETTDGGKNWNQVNLQGDGHERLVKLIFTNDGFGRAVGETGTIYLMQDDRVTWKKVNLLLEFLLIDGYFSNAKHGIVVGGGGVSMTTDDGGNSWTPSIYVRKSTSKLNAVYFQNQNSGWAVGAGGKILVTVNGGKLWREQVSNTTNDLCDIVFQSNAEGWAVGDNGAVVHTTSGGNQWIPFEYKFHHKLERIFLDGKNGWIVGFGGTVLKYNPNTINKPNPKLAPKK